MNPIEAMKKYFGYDKEIIAIYGDEVYVQSFEKIVSLSDVQIIIKSKKCTTTITGENFKIKKMMEKELLFRGQIKEIKRTYE